MVLVRIFPLSLIVTFSFSGGVCLIYLTFLNILYSRREILKNILLLSSFLCVICMWVMVNQVRQDIKKNMDRQEFEEMDLAEIGDNYGDITAHGLE